MPRTQRSPITARSPRAGTAAALFAETGFNDPWAERFLAGPPFPSSDTDVTSPPEVAATAGAASTEEGAWSPTDDWHASRFGSGTEAPADLPPHAGPRTVIRSFAFLDLCGSTSYLETAGARDAMAAVTEFRGLVREVTARRGIRVAKWMGDGAMLVGVQSGPVVCAAVEICARQAGAALPARAGVAVSAVLLFDGGDYLGRGANFAARLCDAAGAAEVLVDPDCAPAFPDWVVALGSRQVEVAGMGAHRVLHAGIAPGTLLP